MSCLWKLMPELKCIDSFNSVILLCLFKINDIRSSINSAQLLLGMTTLLHPIVLQAHLHPQGHLNNLFPLFFTSFLVIIILYFSDIHFRCALRGFFPATVNFILIFFLIILCLITLFLFFCYYSAASLFRKSCY